MKKDMLFAILFTLGITLCLTVYIYLKTNDTSEILQLNWDISISDQYTEIYSTSDGASFTGDGYRYAVLQYESLDALHPSFTWYTDQNPYLEDILSEFLKYLNIPNEYAPTLESNYYAYQMNEADGSNLYLLFELTTNRLFIFEEIF